MNTPGYVFLCIHGAGSSALTFAALAEKLKAEHTVVAFDWRGHGSHVREDEMNLTVDTLIQEGIEVLNETHARFP